MIIHTVCLLVSFMIVIHSATQRACDILVNSITFKFSASNAKVNVDGFLIISKGCNK